MLVSIIVPTYNRLDYLRQTIESMVAQTHGDIEIIIVDDESQEDVEGLARSFGDERIRFHRAPHSGYPGVNINRGLPHARGEAVMTVGSDDNLLPDCVRKLAGRLDGNPKYLMVRSDLWIIDGEGKRIKPASEMMRDRNAYKDGRGCTLRVLLEGNITPGTTALIRKDALLRLGGFSEDPLHQGAEDYEMAVRFARVVWNILMS